MATVLQVSDTGEQVREPVHLRRQHRKLSSIMKQQERRKGIPYIVSIHRAAEIRAVDVEALRLNDNNTPLRENWKNVLVGKDDVVVITYLPLGGMMGGGGGKKGGGKNIGMMLAMLVLAVVAPMIVGAIGGPLAAAGGGLSMLGKLVTTGLVAGLQYFMSMANKPKANKTEEQRPLYGVSGGGNLPRPGDRIPVHYGRTWINPDLSQPDYFYYEGIGEDGGGQGDSRQVLIKRMTIGMGEYDIKEIRQGQAIIWRNGTFRNPFTDADYELIEPGARSSIAPSSVYSSDQVNGAVLPRPGDDSGVSWMGPFIVVPAGETTKKIQLDYSLPEGLYAISKKNGKKLSHVVGVLFEYSELSENDNPIGWKALYAKDFSMNTTRAQRYTKYVTVPEGRYAVRARNLSPHYEGDLYTGYDQITWDGARAFLDKEPRRTGITELALKIKSGKGTGNAPFSDIWVEIQRKLPTSIGQGWSVPIATRKAIWAAVDILRNPYYGCGLTDDLIDLQKFIFYAATLTENDTCNGTIRGPVSVMEAVNTVLGTIRSEVSMIGGIWSMTRDEARTARKHVITRRNIVKDSSGVDYDLDLGDGSSDVIVEYFVEGDPKKRHEHRETIGGMSNTPRRISLFGVTEFNHAVKLAKWYAAVAYWRRQNRLFTTENQGKIFNRNEPALIDTWFLDETKAAGVAATSGLNITLDADIPWPAGPHVVFRTSNGTEWGPVGITPTGPRTFLANATDVNVIQGWTGQALGNLFTRSARKMPVTAMIGTIDSTTEQYIIRSTRYTEEGHVEVSAVNDSNEVWSILGEAPPPVPPITSIVLREQDLMPVVPWIRAMAVQKSVALILEWSIGDTRGAVGYIVDIKYGEETDNSRPWETIHYGPGSDGAYMVDYDETASTLRVRGRAYNMAGVVSEAVYTTASLFKPYITGEIASMLIELEMLQEQVRKDIQAISEIGAGSLREGMKRIEERVNELAAAAATEAGDSYEARQLVKVSVDGAYAAIKRETTLRVSDQEALAQQITTQAARLGTAEAAITTEQTARVTADDALSQQITTLTATSGGNSAALNEERIARIAGDQANSSIINTVSSTVSGHTTTITQVQSSVNGVKAEFGVAIVVDGTAVGGYRLTGFRKLDGTFQSQFGIHGDLVVNGTIWGTKVATSGLITANAQIGNLVVGTHNIQTGAISQVVKLTREGAASSTVNIFLRPGASYYVIGTMVAEYGQAISDNAIAVGVELRASGDPFITAFPNRYNSGGVNYALNTTLQGTPNFLDTGSYSFSINATGAYAYASIVVLELVK